jgi:hypothetical protein
MRVDLELAGCRTAWRFQGSATLQVWLDQRPWMEQGGLCVVRAPADRFTLDQLVIAIRKAAYAANEDVGYFTVRVVPCGAGAGTPREALMRHFDLAPNTPPMAAREPIRLKLSDRRQLLVFVEEGPVSADDWDAFIALCEHYRKAAHAVPLAVVALDTRAQLTCEPVCHFTTGYADGQVLADAAETGDAILWARYLHMRAWWDSGGAVPHAWALSRRMIEIKVGDDHLVEKALQEYALEQADCPEALPLLRSWLEVKRAPAAVDVEATLLGSGLLWRPPGMRGLQVVPRIARVLLVRSPLSESNILRLRPNVICAPLVNELLSLCLFLESRIRLRLSGRGDISRLSEETVRRHAAFCRGNDRQTHYPEDHPSPPSRDADVWAFASLGEVLRCCPPGATSDPDREVRDLRNGLAHGHYVAWWHCTKAINVLRLLDKS